MKFSPSLAERSVATILDTMSVLMPAGNGQMIVTGRDGHVSAKAAIPANGEMVKPPNTERNSREPAIAVPVRSVINSRRRMKPSQKADNLASSGDDGITNPT